MVLLGIIIIGIAIAVSINVFRESAISSKRDLVINECINLAILAMNYYNRSENFGGGNKSFLGWQIPDNLKTTASGTYKALVYKDSVVILGTGNEVVTGTDSVKVRTTAFSKFYKTIIIK